MALHHLGTGQKCRVSGPHPSPARSEMLGVEARELRFNKLSQVTLMCAQV